MIQIFDIFTKQNRAILTLFLRNIPLRNLNDFFLVRSKLSNSMMVTADDTVGRDGK